MSKLPNAKAFAQTIADYAEHYPYVIYAEVRESQLRSEASEFPIVQIYLKQPFKLNWHLAEFLSFEGAEFAEATAQLLRGRAATVSERLHFQADSLPWTRIAFILQLDQENRQEGSHVRVRNLGWSRRIWRAQQYFARRRLELPAQLAWRLFRKRSLWLVYASLGETSMRQLLHMSLLSIDALSIKLN